MEINQIIDGLIFALNQRRFHLLSVVREKRKEITAVQTERDKVKKQLKKPEYF